MHWYKDMRLISIFLNIRNRKTTKIHIYKRRATILFTGPRIDGHSLSLRSPPKQQIARLAVPFPCLQLPSWESPLKWEEAKSWVFHHQPYWCVVESGKGSMGWQRPLMAADQCPWDDLVLIDTKCLRHAVNAIWHLDSRCSCSSRLEL